MSGEAVRADLSDSSLPPPTSPPSAPPSPWLHARRGKQRAGDQESHMPAAHRPPASDRCTASSRRPLHARTPAALLCSHTQASAVTPCHSRPSGSSNGFSTLPLLVPPAGWPGARPSSSPSGMPDAAAAAAAAGWPGSGGRGGTCAQTARQASISISRPPEHMQPRLPALLQSPAHRRGRPAAVAGCCSRARARRLLLLLCCLAAAARAVQRLEVAEDLLAAEAARVALGGQQFGRLGAQVALRGAVERVRERADTARVSVCACV